MPITVKDYLDKVESFIKQAGDRESENITGQDVDSLPGSEHDKDIPSDATKPSTALRDDTIDNMKNRTLDGAKPGSDAPVVEEGYDAEEPVLTPDKKPLDTADANAKEAADLGNNLVDMILGKKATAQRKPAQKQAAPVEKINVDINMLAKIAAITLADEEGQFVVQQALAKRAGAEFANEVFDALEKRAAEEQAYYMFEKGAQDAEAMIGDLAEAQGAANAEDMIGDAAEAQGAADAQALINQGVGLEDGAAPQMSLDEAAAALDEFSADEIVEAVNSLAEEGTIDQETAAAVTQAVLEGAQEEGEPDDISEEDVAEAISEAIDSGELSPEDAQALVQMISEETTNDEAAAALANDVTTSDAANTAADAATDTVAAQKAEKAASVKKAESRRLAHDLISAIKNLK